LIPSQGILSGSALGLLLVLLSFFDEHYRDTVPDRVNKAAGFVCAFDGIAFEYYRILAFRAGQYFQEFVIDLFHRIIITSLHSALKMKAFC